MKVVIDCRFWGPKHTGLGRYTQSLVTQILYLDHQNKYFLLSSPEDELGLGRLAKKNGQVEVVKVNARHYSFQEQLVLPGLLNQIKPDLIHFLHFNIPIFYRGKFIVTVHDLTKHFFKGRKTTTRWPGVYWLKYGAYRLVVKKAVSRAEHILVPSEFVKNQLTKFYNLPKSKITVTYEGKDPVFTSFENWKLKIENYLLYVGNLYPHKNVLTLVKAIKIFNKNQSHKKKLIIVGAKDAFWQRFKTELKSLNAINLVEFKFRINDQQLKKLYQQSLAVVMPSFMEGFGLPGVEAMASGGLVIAAQAGCLPEIYGPGAIYFNPTSPDDLAAKISQIDKYSKPVRQQMIKKAQDWVARYDWQKTAKETVNIYEKVHRLA